MTLEQSGSAQLNAQAAAGEFPRGELNQRRVTAVEEAIKSIETATTHPDLRHIAAAGESAR